MGNIFERKMVEISETEYKSLLRESCKIEALKNYMSECECPKEEIILSILGVKRIVKVQ